MSEDTLIEITAISAGLSAAASVHAAKLAMEGEGGTIQRVNTIWGMIMKPILDPIYREAVRRRSR